MLQPEDNGDPIVEQDQPEIQPESSTRNILFVPFVIQDDLRLSRDDISVWMALKRASGFGNRQSTIDQASLERLARLPRQKISLCLHRLREAGYVTWKRRGQGRSNHYVLTNLVGVAKPLNPHIETLRQAKRKRLSRLQVGAASGQPDGTTSGQQDGTTSGHSCLSSPICPSSSQIPSPNGDGANPPDSPADQGLGLTARPGPEKKEKKDASAPQSSTPVGRWVEAWAPIGAIPFGRMGKLRQMVLGITGLDEDEAYRRLCWFVEQRRGRAGVTKPEWWAEGINLPANIPPTGWVPNAGDDRGGAGSDQIQRIMGRINAKPEKINYL